MVSAISALDATRERFKLVGRQVVVAVYRYTGYFVQAKTCLKYNVLRYILFQKQEDAENKNSNDQDLVCVICHL